MHRYEGRPHFTICMFRSRVFGTSTLGVRPGGNGYPMSADNTVPAARLILTPSCAKEPCHIRFTWGSQIPFALNFSYLTSRISLLVGTPDPSRNLIWYLLLILAFVERHVRHSGLTRNLPLHSITPISLSLSGRCDKSNTCGEQQTIESAARITVGASAALYTLYHY